MRLTLIAVGVLLCTAFGSGCSRQEPAPAAQAPAQAPAAEQSAPAAAPTPNSELQQAIQQPLDKAKAVEGQLQQDKENLDREVDAQGG